MTKNLLLLLALCATSLDTKSNPNTDLYCLASNIYHEARGEAQEGQIAVGMVTINRARSASYPSSVCSVVYQPSQFSWVKNKQQIKNKRVYENMLQLASDILNGEYVDNTHGALYFNTAKSKPTRNSKITAKIGNHYFFK